MPTVTLTLDADTAHTILATMLADRTADEKLEAGDMLGFEIWSAMRDEHLKELGLPSRKELLAIAYPDKFAA